MTASWSFVLSDSAGNDLTDLSTASGLSVSASRNSYWETTLTLSHEDEAASALLSTLGATGVPKLKAYRKGRQLDTEADITYAARPKTLMFRGPLVGLQEVSEESSLLTATFRSPFAVLAGDGDKTGRFVAPTGSLVSTAGVAGSYTNDASVGSVAWSISNTTGEVLIPASQQTEYLKATAFSFAIPAGAIIDGFVVTVNREAVSAVMTDTDVRIVKGGTIQATDRSNSNHWLEYGYEAVSYGASNDLWGTTWTAADVNSAGFGVAISASSDSSGGGVANIRDIAITVYYSMGVVEPLAFGAVDAGAIAKTLIDLTNADGFTGLATSPGLIAPTVLRDRTFPLGQNIGAAITDLTAVLDGFDFYETFVDGPGATDAFFNVTAEQGQVLQTAHFEYGPGTLSNVAHMERTTMAPQNTILVTGGNGLTSLYSDPTSVATYGEWWAHSDFATVIEQDTLDAKARALVRTKPVKTITFVPELGLDNCPKPFDDWNLGDTVELYASRGALTENTQLRINGFTIPIDENGYETVAVNDPTTPEEDAVTTASLVAEVLAS